jgi:hypothetical protein
MSRDLATAIIPARSRRHARATELNMDAMTILYFAYSEP